MNPSLSLVGLARLFLREIRELREAVQAHANAIRSADETGRKNSDIPEQAPVLRAELHIPEHIEAQTRDDQKSRQAQDKKNYRVQLALAIGTWLAFIAAVVLAGIAWGQWTEMRKTTTEAVKATKASEKAAKAAEDSVSAMRDQTQLEQRAWIGISGYGKSNLEVGKHLLVEVEAKNTGPTPALDVRAIAVVLPTAPGKRPSAIYEVPINYGVVQPNGVFYSNMNATKRSATGLNQNGLEMVKSGRLVIFVQGIVCYKDVFEREHWTTFCSKLVPETGVFASCGFGNDVDRKPEQTHPQCRKPN